MAKNLCKILGVVLALVGVAGFLKPDLLGLHLTAAHNIVHLLTAAIALYIGFMGTAGAARTFNQVFGVIYLLLGILGFIAPGLIASVIQSHATEGLAMDNVVHLLIGLVCAVVGFMRAPQTAATT